MVTAIPVSQGPFIYPLRCVLLLFSSRMAYFNESSSCPLFRHSMRSRTATSRPSPTASARNDRNTGIQSNQQVTGGKDKPGNSAADSKPVHGYAGMPVVILHLPLLFPGK